MRLLSKQECQYIHLEIVRQQSNYEPKHEEIYHHFGFPSISQRWAAHLNMRSSSEENHSQPWVASLEDGSACRDPTASVRRLRMERARTPWAMLGSWCQRQQEGRFRAERSQKKEANAVVWSLGQRSLCCPQHLSFQSLGMKTDLNGLKLDAIIYSHILTFLTLNSQQMLTIFALKVCITFHNGPKTLFFPFYCSCACTHDNIRHKWLSHQNTSHVNDQVVSFSRSSWFCSELHSFSHHSDTTAGWISDVHRRSTGPVFSHTQELHGWWTTQLMDPHLNVWTVGRPQRDRGIGSFPLCAKYSKCFNLFMKTHVSGGWFCQNETYGCFVSACVHFRIREEHCNVMWFWWSSFIPKGATPNPLEETCKLFFLKHAHQNPPF